MPIRSLWRDCRYAVRLLGKSPVFTAVAVLTLALGIGANTAIFTVTNALLLRPLPYRNPQALMLVTSLDRAEQVGCLTYPRYTLIAADHRGFSAIAAFAPDTANLTGLGDAEQAQVARVSWNFFDVLGVRPAVGRGFVRADEDSPAVIIGDSLRARAFPARADLVGQTIVLDGRARTIVGVLPAGFTFGLLNSRVEIWMPRIDELSLATPEQVRGGTCYLNAVGRLASGTDPAPAQAHMDALNARYAREFRGLPDADPRRRMRVQPLRDVLVAGTGPLILTLTAAVSAVLLVACANVAGLFLVRALGRRREIAIRAALGASRAALVRQVLAESLVLALAGGCAGVILAAWAVRGLGATLTGLLPRGNQIVVGIDLRVLGFAAVLSLVTGIVFGLWPAIHASKANLLVLSRGDDAPVIGRIRSGVARRVVVAAQIALTVVLLVAAGLLIRTFWRLYNLDAGFDPRGTVTMNLSLPRSGYATPAEMVAFYERLLNRVQALGVVRSAACASALPVNPSRASPVLVEGQPAVPLAERPIVAIQMVLGPYFRTMRIPLVRGRLFDERDVAASQPVVIVNEAVARRFFAGENPLGRHITLGRRPVPAEIVGVVGDVKNQALATDPVPEIEVPFTQLAWASMNLIVRAAGDPQAAMGSVRAAIRSVDPNLPATRVQTMEDVLAKARSRPKVVMALLSLFAATAVVLATVGLYGSIAYTVRQHTHEMGIRVALGARHTELIGTVVRQGVALTSAGIAAGLAMSLAATRLLANQVYGVKTTDALAFSMGPAIFLVVAALASWIPARRIARVDPSRSLREE